MIEEALGDTRIAYAYGNGGNRTKLTRDGNTTTYKYDADDREISANDETFSWDANGNLLERKNAEGVTRYTYDAEDRLESVTRPDNVEIRFGYSPTGQRAWRSEAGKKTYYVYDGLDLVAELDAEMKTVASFVHGWDIDQPLVTIAGGNVGYYHADPLGSIASITDKNGKPIAAYEYDAFGNQVATTKPAIANPFTFTGREFDATTGLYYYRARYYDAKLGRFLSRDPVGAPLSQPIRMNPYLYARNNPLNAIDPLGTADTFVGPGSPIWQGGWVGRPETPSVLADKLKIVQTEMEYLKSPHHVEDPQIPKWRRGVERFEADWKADIKSLREQDVLKLAREEARLQRALQTAKNNGAGSAAEGAAAEAAAGRGNPRVVRGGGQAVPPETPTLTNPHPEGGGPPGPRVVRGPNGVPQPEAPTVSIPEPLPGGGSGGVNWGRVGRAGGLAAGGGLLGANVYACLQEGKSKAECALEAAGGVAIGIVGSVVIAAVAGTAAPAILAGAAVLGTLQTAERIGNLPGIQAAQQHDAWIKANLDKLAGVTGGLHRKIDALSEIHNTINSKRQTTPQSSQTAIDADQTAARMLAQLKSSLDGVLAAAKLCKQAQSVREQVEASATKAVQQEQQSRTELDAADAQAGLGTTPEDGAKARALYERARTRAVEISSEANDARVRNDSLRQIIGQSQDARRQVSSVDSVIAEIVAKAEAAEQARDAIELALDQCDIEMRKLNERIEALRAEVGHVKSYFPANNANVEGEFQRLYVRLDEALKWRPEGSTVPADKSRADSAAQSARQSAITAKSFAGEMKAYELCDSAMPADTAVQTAEKAKNDAMLRLAASADLPGRIANLQPKKPANDGKGTTPGGDEPGTVAGTGDDIKMPTGPQRVTVPSVLLAPAAQAKARLTGAGFVVSLAPAPSRTPSKAEEFKIQRQDPNAGEEADKGSTVLLTVYGPFGDDPILAPEVPGKVRVRSVLTLTPGEARAVLAGDKLKVAVTPASTSPASKELEYAIQRQDPAGGTDVDPGSVVTLTVYGPFTGSDIATTETMPGTNSQTTQPTQPADTTTASSDSKGGRWYVMQQMGEVAQGATRISFRMRWEQMGEFSGKVAIPIPAGQQAEAKKILNIDKEIVIDGTYRDGKYHLALRPLVEKLERYIREEGSKPRPDGGGGGILDFFGSNEIVEVKVAFPKTEAQVWMEGDNLRLSTQVMATITTAGVPGDMPHTGEFIGKPEAQ